MTAGRVNQKARTRLALLRAATELVREGKPASIPDTAERALVSVATAYRYFPNADDLWAEAAFEAIDFFEFDELEARVRAAGDDVEARLEIVMKGLAWKLLDEEVLSRWLTKSSLDRWFAQQNMPAAERQPVREARRHRWNSLAIEPLRGRLSDEECERLVVALDLIWGPETVVALYDVSGIDSEAAKETQLRTGLWILRGAIADAGTPAP